MMWNFIMALNVQDIGEGVMNFRDILDRYEKELEIASRSEDYEKQALLFNYISAIHRLMGNWNQSYKCQQEGLRLARSSPLATCVAFCNLGALCVEMSKFSEAEQFLSESLDIAKQLKNPLRVASAEGNLGKMFLYRGMWDKASIHYMNALHEGEKVNSIRHQMCSFTSLGKMEFDRGNYGESKKYFDKANKFAEILKNELKELETADDHSSVERTPLDNGSNTLEETIKQYRDIFVLELAEIRLTRYQGRLTLNDIQDTISSTLQTAQRLNYKYGEIEVLLERSRCHQNMKKWENALNDALAAIELAKGIGAKRLEAFAQLELGIVYSNIPKEYANANNQFSRSKEIFKTAGDIYNYHKVSLYNGLLSMKQTISKEAGMHILEALQGISYTKVYESIDVLTDIFELFENLHPHLDKAINEVLNKTDVRFLKMDDEKQCSKNLIGSLQSHYILLNWKSIVQIIARCTKLLDDLCPTDSYVNFKDKIRNLNDSIKYMIDSLESIDKIVQSVAVIYENEMLQAQQKREKQQSVMFQIIQSSLSSLGATSIYNSLLLSNGNKLNINHLIYIAITLVAWALLPVCINKLWANIESKKLILPMVSLILCVSGIVVSIMHLVGGIII